MKYVIILLIGCVLFLGACRDNVEEKKTLSETEQKFYQPQTPQELDDYIVNISAGINSRAVVWASKFQDKKYSELINARIRISDYMDSSITELEKIKDIEGSERYRATTLSMLKNYRDFLNAAYTPFDTITNATTDEQINHLTTKLAEAAGEDPEISRVADSARIEYCKKNNLNYTL